MSRFQLGGEIFWICYGNIPDAFRVFSYPPLGLTDHNVICLLPLYRQELKRHKPQCYSAPQWSKDPIAHLQGSLACNDWSVFDGDLNDRVSVITNYTNFCINIRIPVKTIKNYPEPKRKHEAFRLNNWEGLKLASRKIKNEVCRAKLKFKDKLESEFASMYTKQAFQKVKILTGCESKFNISVITDPESFAK